MELLWPGHTYSSARGNLNVCLYGVRQALGGGADGFVVYRDGCYGLNRDRSWSVDLERFVRAAGRHRRRLEAGDVDGALAAGRVVAAEYRGPLFDGDPVADWSLAERVRLHETLLRVLETMGELCLRRGDLEGAVQALERALREDPCRESAHRALMQCFALRGQRDQVVRQFHRCVAVRDGEREVTPSQETAALFAELTSR